MNDDETLVASSPPSSRAPEASHPAEIGRYSVVRELGRGGMGVVLLARDPALDRDVAIKLLRASAERQAELLVEAQTMARLSHPNVLAVYDAGTVDGRTFVAMERVRGGTLREWLARRARHPGEILDAFEQAGEGLAAAHRAGLVHRDVKPDNMLVGDDGRVRVSDFGLALPADLPEPGNKAAISPGSSVAGTPAYMAPEQIEGAPTDARADQFAFCVALFEALYGERPFPGSTLSARYGAIWGGELAPMPAVADVPEGIADVLRRGLSASTGGRYESMDALLTALRAARRGNAGVSAAAGRGAAVWSRGARDAVRARFDAVGLPHVTQTARHVIATLDAHTAAWVDAAEWAIALAHEDPFYFADAIAHVEQAYQELASLVGLLEQVDPTLFANSYAGTLELRPLSEYRISEDVRTPPPRPPREPTRRRASQVLRGQVLRADILGRLRRPDAVDLARDAVAQLEGLNDPPTLADALLVHGKCATLGGNAVGAGMASLERALEVARRCGHAHTAAAAAIQLARALTGLASGLPTGRLDPLHANALIDEAAVFSEDLGRPARLECDIAQVRATLASKRDEHDAALVALDGALAGVVSAFGPRAAEQVPVLIQRGIVLGEAGRHSQAVLASGLAVDLLVEALGPLHPGLARARDFYAHSLMSAGRLQAATDEYDQLANLLDAIPSPDLVRRYWCDHKRGEIAVSRGELVDAERWLRRSLDGYTTHFGAEHHNALMGPADHLALSRWLLGDPDAALAHADEVIARSQTMTPPPLLSRLVRAELRARVGAPSEGHAILDALPEDLEGHGYGLTESVDVWRARVLMHEGRHADALRCFERALSERHPTGPRERYEVFAERAVAQVALDLPGAEAALRDVLATAERELPALTWPLQQARLQLPTPARAS